MTTKDEPAAEPAKSDSAKGDAKAADAGTKAVEEVLDAEEDQGFRGTKVDPTPNENYTVEGVLAGAPTPETDEKAADEARKAAGR